jgi:hypothetical protein
LKLRNYFLYVITGISVVFLLTGCDGSLIGDQSNKGQSAAFNLTKDQWKNEIQQRFDTINGNGEPIKCIVAKNEYLPGIFYGYGHDTNLIKLSRNLVKAGLLTEKIEVGRLHQYTFELTDEGKKYRRTWPDSGREGFCFGKIIVKSISKITPIHGGVNVEYQYIFDKLPPKLEPEGSLHTDIAKFRYDKQTKQLYSESGIGLIVESYLD